MRVAPFFAAIWRRSLLYFSTSPAAADLPLPVRCGGIVASITVIPRPCAFRTMSSIAPVMALTLVEPAGSSFRSFAPSMRSSSWACASFITPPSRSRPSTVFSPALPPLKTLTVCVV